MVKLNLRSNTPDTGLSSSRVARRIARPAQHNAPTAHARDWFRWSRRVRKHRQPTLALLRGGQHRNQLSCRPCCLEVGRIGPAWHCIPRQLCALQHNRQPGREALFGSCTITVAAAAVVPRVPLRVVRFRRRLGARR